MRVVSLDAMIAPGHLLDLRFRCKAVHGGVVKEMAFADLLTGRTIVSVFMKNRTPSCDRQKDRLATAAAELADYGYQVIGLSRDTAGSHLRYAAAKKIPYPLVSDPEDRFARAADALIEKSMYGRAFVGPARAAYLLERNGTVLAVIEKVDPANHATELLALVRSLPPAAAPAS